MVISCTLRTFTPKISQQAYGLHTTEEEEDDDDENSQVHCAV